MASNDGKNYVLGRGKLYFDRYPANATVVASLLGEGERYLGNTPEFSSTVSAENLDHFDSDQGVREKDDSVQLSMDRTAAFVTDNISIDNIALFFAGSGETVAQSALTDETNVVTVKRNRFYQLGADETNPSGFRNVTSVVAAKGVAFGTPITAAGNFEVDPVLGRVYIESDAPDIPDDTEVQFTFNVSASSRTQVISSSDSIYGALRYVADNPKGPNSDFYFPYVKLSPDGDYQLKGDEWQQIGFAVEVLKKGTLQAIYIDGRPSA